MIIGIAGGKGSGKKTLADLFVREGFTKIGFTDNTKEMCAYSFGIPVEYFYNNALKETIFHNPIVIVTAHIDLINKWISKTHSFKVPCLPHVGRKITTPQALLQYVERNIITAIHTDYDREVLLAKVEGVDNIVCPDVRDLGELKFLDNLAAQKKDLMMSIYVSRHNGNNKRQCLYGCESSVMVEPPAA